MNYNEHQRKIWANVDGKESEREGETQRER